MADSNRGSVSRQVRSLLATFLQGCQQPFREVLTEDLVLEALRAEAVTFRQRVFTPLVTLWAFLTQVFDKDYACRQAVARVAADRLARGRRPCAAGTGAYCKARQRLPEAVLARLARRTGADLHAEAPAAWRWRGRAVKVVDGSSVSMPDTKANQKAYPQPGGQRPGLGFPVARVVALFCLASGALLDLALGPCKGKRTGENALLRGLHEAFAAGDVVLADRYYCSYFEIALLQERGADVVLRLHQRRKADFRRGRRLGPDDHVVVWDKPPRPEWMDRATYARLPGRLAVRELRVRVRAAGFRSRTVLVATTLLDAGAFPKADLAALYRARWHAELDLRSLKHALHLDGLRGRSPEMVRKEVWAHLLVYNLIRAVMARAALEHHVPARSLSFAGARQTLEAFREELERARGARAEEVAEAVLRAIASHRVGNRPDRVEPRVRKRRPKQYPLMTEPRAQAKARLMKGHKA